MRIYVVWGYLTLIFLTSVGCSTAGRNKGDLNVYSVMQDSQLGAQWASYVQKEMPMLFDDRLVTYIDSVGQKLVTQFPGDRLFDYRFRIIKDPQVNAFALPGGYVYVNLGLLQTVESEAELASVIGHEIGHVVFRHGTEQLTKSQGFSCCLSVGSAAIGLGPSEVDIINLFGQTGLLYYGRAAELEADRFGIEAMYKSNYDIQESAKFFEALAEIQKGKPSLLDKLLSTHPPNKDRIKQAKEQISEYPLQKNPIISSKNFEIMKQHLQKYPNKYKKSQLRQQFYGYLLKHSPLADAL